MGIWAEMFKEIQLSPVMKERVALADDKVHRLEDKLAEANKRIVVLEGENKDLRRQVVGLTTNSESLSVDSAAVLVMLFRANAHGLAASRIAVATGVEAGVIQYHIDDLCTRRLVVDSGCVVIGQESNWIITPAGRRHVVERGLHMSSAASEVKR